MRKYKAKVLDMFSLKRIFSRVKDQTSITKLLKDLQNIAVVLEFILRIYKDVIQVGSIKDI